MAEIRSTEPHIAPLPSQQYGPLYESLFGEKWPEDRELLNIALTWARHPSLMKAERSYADYLLRQSTLAHRKREQELTIIRIGWLCRSEYVYGQHVIWGRAIGLSEQEIEWIQIGPNCNEWSIADATILRAVDDLITSTGIAKLTWKALTHIFTDQEILDFILFVGRYWSVCATVKSVMVQLENGKAGFPGN